MHVAVERSRLLVGMASAVLIVTTIATLGWAVALTVEFVGNLVDDGWRSTALLEDLLELIDLLLVATVQVIVAIGLWELFVAPLDVPEWLRVSDFGQLKTALAELIVLVIAIKFVEKLIKTEEALDVLYYAGAVSVVGVMLVALTAVKKAPKGSA